MAGMNMQVTAVLGRDAIALPDRLPLAWLPFAYSQFHSHMRLLINAGSPSWEGMSLMICRLTFQAGNGCMNAQ